MVKKDLRKISRNLMYKEVAERIRLLIEQEGLWGRFLAPERELAETFGVSRDTVRKGLDELEDEGLLLRRQGFGTQVRPRDAAAISTVSGRLLVGISGGYPSDFIRGIAEAAGQEQWLSFFCNLMNPMERADFLAKLRGSEYQGAVLLSVSDARTVEQTLEVWGGPLVVVDHHFPGLPVTCVMEDCAAGVRQAVEHVLELGHRRIGLVTHSRRVLNPWKEDGYFEAMREAGLEDERLMARAEATFEAGQRGGEELLGLSDPPTAIIASSDRQAWGVWRAAELAGRSVGKDFALVGYGDESAAAGFHRVLSSVSFDMPELGRAAVRKTVELARRRAEPGELVLIPTSVAIRDSSKDVRPRAAEK